MLLALSFAISKIKEFEISKLLNAEYIYKKKGNPFQKSHGKYRKNYSLKVGIPFFSLLVMLSPLKTALTLKRINF